MGSGRTEWMKMTKKPYLFSKYQLSGEKGASVISRLTFSWLSKLINLGNTKILTQDDMWRLMGSDTSEDVTARFREILEEQVSSRKSANATSIHQWSLFWALFTLVKSLLAYQWTCALLSSIFTFAGPYFLFQILETIQIGGDFLQVIWYLIYLFTISCLKAVIDGQVVINYNF